MYNLSEYGQIIRIRELNEFISYILKNIPDELASVELIKDAQDEIDWIENRMEEQEEEKLCHEMSCDDYEEYD